MSYAPPRKPKARWLYALGRIFANVAPANVQIYEQRHVTEAAVAAFAAMPVRYLAVQLVAAAKAVASRVMAALCDRLHCDVAFWSLTDMS